MKKKLLAALMATTTALCGTFGLSACGNNGGDSEYGGNSGNTEQDGAIVSTPTEGLEYTISADETYYICSGIGSVTDTKIVIASEYNGKPVASIGSGTFTNCAELTSVTIPNKVTYISDGAFKNCYKLTRIYFDGTYAQWNSIEKTVFWFWNKGVHNYTICCTDRDVKQTSFISG